MASITLEQLSKSFDNDVKVFENISLAIEENEFFVLVGPSGSGKSTLLRLIAGLDSATSGKIKFFDRDVTTESPEKRGLSMVFQSYALFPHMDVRENILFGLADKKISESEQEKRLKEAVSLTNLEAYLDRRPKKLSGGQRQRLALARAIASKQPIMLMDEPLSNLDAKLRENMRSQIKQLQRELKTTIVYVTHDQTEAMTMGDRIALLNEGELQQLGRPLELYNKPKNLFVASFIGTPKINLFRLTINGNQLNNPEMTAVFARPDISFDMQEVYLGVRAEHLTLTHDREVANIIGQVLNVEQLGSETLVSFELEGQTYRAKLQGQLMLEPGSEIYLIADQKKLHYFDVKTELRLGLGEASQNE